MVDRYSEHDVEAREENGYAVVSAESNNNASSRVPTSVEFPLLTNTDDASSDLQGQLELALKEIARLKCQISTITEQSA